MRARWFVLGGLIASAAGASAACADSEDAGGIHTGTSDPPPVVSNDSGPEASAPGERPGSDAGLDADASRTRCSSAGWCVTALPDVDLELMDIWPLERRAFAIADSPTLGIRVLEWNADTDAWGYIDDYTQNEPGLGLYTGGIWAPSDDEVYFGVGPGYIYHGIRGAIGWTWTRQKVPNNNLAAGAMEAAADVQIVERSSNAKLTSLGIWGSSASDVHAYYANTIYHREVVDGSPGWVEAYKIADKSSGADVVRFFGASGRSADDVWFIGNRTPNSTSICPIVVRKTAGTFTRIADTSGFLCSPQAGYLYLGTLALWDLHPVSATEAVGLGPYGRLTRIQFDGTSYTSTNLMIPKGAADSQIFYSLWASGSEVWMSGASRVVVGSNIWSGGGFGLSTIASDEWNPGYPLFRIRGASTSNLWAIGARYAYHKSTP